MKILVVDDDEATQGVIQAWLSPAGIELEFVVDGDEAFKRYSERGPYDAVLTDFDHPGLDGLELAWAIRKKNPGQAIVVLTAGMPDACAQEFLHLHIPVLLKPVDRQEVIRFLQAATGHSWDGF